MRDIYIDRMEFGRSPEPTATHIFRQQQGSRTLFSTPRNAQNGTFEGAGSGLENFH